MLFPNSPAPSSLAPLHNSSQLNSPSVRTFLLTLQYDGGGFAGWQRQAKGRTVQAELEAVLERLCEAPIRVHGAGRTDAGVHALGIGVSFEMPDRWEAVALRRALNA